MAAEPSLETASLGHLQERQHIALPVFSLDRGRHWEATQSTKGYVVDKQNKDSSPERKTPERITEFPCLLQYKT